MKSLKFKKTSFALALEKINNGPQLTETTTASVVTGMVESDNQMSLEIETPETFAEVVDIPILHFENQMVCMETNDRSQSDTPQTSTVTTSEQVTSINTETTEEKLSDTPKTKSIKDNIKKIHKRNEDQSKYIEILEEIIAELMEKNEQLTSLDVEKPKVIEPQTELIEKLKEQLEKANQTDRVQEEHIIDLSFKLQAATVQQDEVSSLRTKNAEYEAKIEDQEKTIQILTKQLETVNRVLVSQQETIFRLSISESRAPPIATAPIKEALSIAAPPIAAPPIAVSTLPISGAPPPPLPLSKDAPPPPPPMSANWKSKEAQTRATNQSNENTAQSNTKRQVLGSVKKNGDFQNELKAKLKKRSEESENAAEVKVTDTKEEIKVQKEKLEKNQKEVESKLKTMTDELKKAELEVKEKTDLMNQHQSDTDEFKTAKNALDDTQKDLKRLQKEVDKVKKNSGIISQHITISNALMKQRMKVEGGGESCDWD
jgi:chromosome segregation ATPase